MASAGWIVRGVPCAVSALLAVLSFAAPAAASNTMAVQPDGKIVLAGASPQALGTAGTALPRQTLVRFGPDGQLDPGFGAHGGIVDFRSESPPLSAVAVTSRGVYAGSGSVGGYRIARFETDGDVDSDFGTEGEASVSEELGGFDAGLSTIVPLPDGSLIAAGDAHEPGSLEGTGLAFAQLLHPEGSYAETVGRIRGSSADAVGFPTEEDLIRLPDGKLIASGSRTDAMGSIRPYVARFAGADFDTTFGASADGGLVPPTLGRGSRATGLATDAAGRLIVALREGPPGVARLDEDGNRDTSFGDQGTARLPLWEGAMGATAVAVQPDGGILLAGWWEEPCPRTVGCWHVFVARFDPGGSLDDSFGESGVSVLSRRQGDAAQPTAVDVAALAGGGVLVSAVPQLRDESPFFLARLTPTGTLDPGFGQDGIATATPCQGSLVERRDSGCLSHARARLRTSGLSKGKPRARLRVLTDNLLDPMTKVTLVLPRSLRADPRRRGRVKPISAPANGSGRTVRAGRIWAGLPDGARELSLAIAPGVLRRVRPLKRGHKLGFRVDVAFADGSSQRIPVRVKP